MNGEYNSDDFTKREKDEERTLSLKATVGAQEDYFSSQLSEMHIDIRSFEDCAPVGKKSFIKVLLATHDVYYAFHQNGIIDEHYYPLNVYDEIHCTEAIYPDRGAFELALANLVMGMKPGDNANWFVGHHAAIIINYQKVKPTR